jgi:dipeptidyl aminopeptidase/acylaminoacyl peptidase
MDPASSSCATARWPGDYEVCDRARRGGTVREVTALDGVESFVPSPDGAKLLVRHSSATCRRSCRSSMRLAAKRRQLTDTRTADFKSRAWIQPQLVQVPSEAWRRHHLGQVLRAGDDGSGQDVSRS